MSNSIANIFVKHAKSLTTKQRNELPDSAFAGPNRSFPVQDKAHVTAARRLLGRYQGPGDKAAIRSRIEQRAKALGMAKSAAACGYEAHHKYASLVPEPKNGAIVPGPTPAGKVPAPTPFVSSPLSSSKGSPFSSTAKSLSAPKTTVSGSEKKAADDFLAGILGAAGGTVGGYQVGKRIIDPFIGRRAAAYEEMLRKGAGKIDFLAGVKHLATLKNAQKLAPIGAAALGALLLATIAASRARKAEKEKLIIEDLIRQRIRENPDISRYGLNANNILPMNRGFY